MEIFKRYDNPHDVSMRLAGTYLRYRGKCYFADYMGEFNLQLYTPRDVPSKYGSLSPAMIVDANDPELDISSAPLGYCNLPDHGPVYLSRPAERRQRQGVSTNNLTGFDEITRRWCRPVSKFLSLEPQYIIRTVEGQYPTMKEIIEYQNPKMGYAFHRRLCLMPIANKAGEKLSYKIKYMAKFVGILQDTIDGLQAGLIDGHGGNSFLRDVLNRQGVTVHDYA